MDGIMERVRSKVASGYAEGLSSKMRTAFRRAFGFTAKEHRETMVHLLAGGLSLPAPSSREA